ncbi:2OG-Fe(II) oxygenase family protein [Sphingomonas caeni]|uniref:2OG-Fe(II) oxygenase family protein n=1 Tax=Sphingomonas caeni TaxID=2984949 RepID=UPI00222E15C3|nr:2OG-Fe(II) oxygenase family protein [Sphingomonas caeni]
MRLELAMHSLAPGTTDRIPPLDWVGLDRRSADNDMAEALLRDGLARDAGNMLLRRKLAGLLYDQSRLAEAVAVLAPAVAKEDGVALRLHGEIAGAAGDFDAAVKALETANGLSVPGSLVALALAVARRDGLAVASPVARAVLAETPDNWQALGIEASHLTAAGKHRELEELCVDLERRGARNAELFAVWASARAACGDDAGVSRLIDYASFLSVADIGASARARPDDFNLALREELLGHRNLVKPHSSRATIGGERIDDLRTRDSPLVAQLTDCIRDAIDAYAASIQRGARNPLGRYSGGAVTLTIWALILDGAAHEQWHIHPSGLVSGVYYVDVPDGGDGEAGALELGLLPLGGAESQAGWRRIVRPANGLLALFPSSYAHRTIPVRQARNRISIAFDVVRA